jgi:hypothetical protein
MPFRAFRKRSVCNKTKSTQKRRSPFLPAPPFYDLLKAALKTTQTRLSNFITPEFTFVNEDVVKSV